MKNNVINDAVKGKTIRHFLKSEDSVSILFEDSIVLKIKSAQPVECSVEYPTNPICPICHFRRIEPMPELLERIIEKNTIISESVGPAGRELVFKKRGRIVLDDECSHCDHEKLFEFLTDCFGGK